MNNDANQQAGNPAGQQNPAGHCAPGEDGKADQPTLPKDSCPPAGGSQPDAPAPPTIEACKLPCDCPDTPGSTSMTSPQRPSNTSSRGCKAWPDGHLSEAVLPIFYGSSPRSWAFSSGSVSAT